MRAPCRPSPQRWQGALQCALLMALLALAGCGTAPRLSAPPATQPLPPSTPSARVPVQPAPGVPVMPPANSGHGGYYQDDGPGDNPPPNLSAVPDADVRNDPLLPRSNKPYVVFGKTYTPITDDQPYTQVGIGSWYGKKFHGQRTSSGEIYDMYKMTAAHPTLPIPSYARLTNMDNGTQVIVRINDRGPFHSNRAIDVSYTAALKLGLLGKGSHELKIERILPAEIDRMIAARNAPQPAAPIGLRLETTMAAPAVAARTDAASSPSAAPVSVSPEIEALMLADRAPAELPAAASPASGTAAASDGMLVPVSADVAAAKGGYYVQLGAFARAENAESARARLAQAMNNGANLEVVQGGTVYRLFSGPFSTRQEAAQAAQGLPASVGVKPIIVQR